jgi:uncharacterized protein YjiS (DUF1127 family)
MNMFGQIRSWNKVRQARNQRNKLSNELNSLSNRDLHDIGISRSDIPDIAQHSALR